MIKQSKNGYTGRATNGVQHGPWVMQKDTNSNQCKKHEGGGVPLIIHTEIDRHASPEAAAWITFWLALRGDSAVDSGCEFVDIETSVRVQHERMRKQ